MTVGIYALYWEEQDLIYIGQSVNIEKRFKEHIRTLKDNTHSNYKVQYTYNTHSVPILIIIENCAFDDLNTQEIYWTKEFDSINKGLNIIEAGQVGHGPNSNNSKYTKLQILQVFRCLYLTKLKYLTSKDISCKFMVNISTVEYIKAQQKHLWLKEEYPYQYTKMISLDRRDKYLIPGGSYFKSPDGTVVHVPNIRKFARENNLNASCLTKVIKGTRSHHKNWTTYLI